MPRYSLPTTILTLFEQWSPANVAVGETVELANLHLGVGDLPLAFALGVPKAAVSGSTGAISLVASGGLSYTALNNELLGADFWTTPTTNSADGTNQVVCAGSAVTYTLTYDPGATPGAVKPVVNFYLLVVPRIFDAAG